MGFFGLGVQFHDCYRQLELALGREPDFLCDNAPEKWGLEFFGKKCISPRDLRALGENSVVVITIRKYEQIYQQLRQMGFKNIFLACFERAYDVVDCIKELEAEVPAAGLKQFESPVKGKWTLVTGASRGIGRQIGLAMAGLGANIIVHARKKAHTEEVADECSAAGVEVLTISAELGNSAELEAMLENLERRFPPIDIVFNNAAVSPPYAPDPWNIGAEDYLRLYAVNTVAPIRICSRLIPPMIRRGHGRVVNISSTIQKTPGALPYSCSKAALSKFVHDLAPSLLGTGVVMSLLCPGFVRSDMGGPDAPHPVESVIPGALLGALTDEDVNGRWFIAQDYAGLSLQAALKRAGYYYSREGLVDVP